MRHKSLDLICLGRAAVDLYSQQIGARLEDVSSFAKYLGGSSGNCAYGSARLGLASAMLTRVGNEQFGRFVIEEFQRAGVDTSHMPVDETRFTALAILAIKDRDTFPLLFYRKDCADMAISAEDIDADWIASAKALAITGTHLSTETTQGACRVALNAARDSGAKRILDIDYRPVLWGLAELGDGETRYVDDAETTAHLQRWIGEFDLIVGTEEEFHIAGGTTDTVAALKKVRELSDAVLVCKLGALGCTIFDGPVGNSVHDGVLVEGVQVDVLNVLGAGDAFISGFLRGYLRGESWETCATYANACGALVVSRHGCAPAMPTETELFDYLARRDDVARPDRDARLNDLHAKTTRHPAAWGPIYGLAFDHRVQLFDMVGELGVSADRLSPLKELLVRAAEQGLDKAGVAGTPAVLCDDVIGQDALNAMTGRRWWIGRPVEQPGSRPLRFQHGDDIGSQLMTWPAEHIIKCLVFYHPDDEINLRLDQEDRLRQLDEARRVTGHELLIEVIPPKDMTVDDHTVARSLQRMYHLGLRPDWWKLPPMGTAAWQAVREVIERYDAHCRGVVLLGLDAPMEDVKAGFRDASASDICRGFTIGRTLFAEPARRWLAGELVDADFVATVSDNYAELIRTWRQAAGESDNAAFAGALT
ncbi:5-dehydro-2-deoxygluconokinase [Salinisphaera sp. Q1T1-3]|uniref:bifunctional 5-dehydro-2-deoxygluconokinase/5-dehydro-2- deoxyphosphogluconate aldolase n=1 Tax=Salinisphaera sp. Q1T1-3 TaxID=2321229 RepID=UPI000E7550DC|nr:5-dehydro-2-deoxygluconokinase [Salinisphaera sp. Q1T1-3]RJS94774.1 5-dehydro-2-deoxygluconokinase [Salinisphaera sp. Q1T1-3]